MNCPECDTLLMRREIYVGWQNAVIYECPECKWEHTMYFDTIDENKADAVPSDTALKSPAPKGTLPNSSGAVSKPEGEPRG